MGDHTTYSTDLTASGSSLLLSQTNIGTVYTNAMARAQTLILYFGTTATNVKFNVSGVSYGSSTYGTLREMFNATGYTSGTATWSGGTVDGSTASSG